MPRKSLMRYEGHPNYRWVKMFKGVRYRVTCDELNMPRNEAESYQAANEWWLGRLEMLTGAARQPSYKDLEPHEYVGYGVPTTPTAKTIGHWVTRFLDLERPRIKPQSFREIRKYLERLTTTTTFFSANAPLSSITPTTVDDHYSFLVSLEIEPGGKNKYLGFFRRFVRWLDRRELITEPKNLKDPQQRFKDPPKKIREYDDVGSVVNSLPDAQRLWALLGLNCGMTQADWGALDWEQIDLKRGTLERKRVKLENVKNAPTVVYRLWPETLALLNALPNKAKSGLVFRSKNGKPMYVVEYVERNGGVVEKKTDYFSTVWNRLEPKPEISPAKFRNIGDTILKKRAEFRGFKDVYLANTPSDIADRHYGAETFEPGCPFWAVLDYIRQQTITPPKPAKKSPRRKPALQVVG